ncbi:hypothetical protein D9M71_755020 [compost metagenome]
MSAAQETSKFRAFWRIPSRDRWENLHRFREAARTSKLSERFYTASFGNSPSRQAENGHKLTVAAYRDEHCSVWLNVIEF